MSLSCGELQCTDIQVQAKNGTAPYTLTVRNYSYRPLLRYSKYPGYAYTASSFEHYLKWPHQLDCFFRA